MNKKRNSDWSKLRRPLRRPKMTEGIYGSTFLYFKFLLVWALVLMADFILQFRFEYLWPLWLMVHSIYDSFKYQGMAFSVFFVCIAITSDVICYLFIPVQWLFFAASTYVWVQYVWQTERGFCLPTISLWVLFIYTEASVRLREEFKSLPLHLILCRPFAAHCVGYPVITLGFGFKSYISYKLRLNRQREVQKENEYYVELLREALPPQLVDDSDKLKALPSSHEDIISNGISSSSASALSSPSIFSSLLSSATRRHMKIPDDVTNKELSTTSSSIVSSSAVRRKDSNFAENGLFDDYEYMQQSSSSPSYKRYDDDSDDDDDDSAVSETSVKASSSCAKVNGVVKTTVATSSVTTSTITMTTTAKLNSLPATKESGGVGPFGVPCVGAGSNKSRRANNVGNVSTASTMTTATANGTLVHSRDDTVQRLELEIKKLKADLQVSKGSEQDLRSQLNNHTIGDKFVRTELHQLHQDNETLQSKLNSIVSSRQQDKQNLASMEKKLQEEKKMRTSLEQQLSNERKNLRKAEDSMAAASRLNMTQLTKVECLDSCIQRRKELDSEVQILRRELRGRDELIRQLEWETQQHRQYGDSHNETDVLKAALLSMQEKNIHLETCLSAETRLKLDLFSALGEAKRQFEIQQGLLAQREAEIKELQFRVTEVMALMPVPYTSIHSSNVTSSTLRYSPANAAIFSASSHSHPHPHPHSTNNDLLALVTSDRVTTSDLNPNATDFLPPTSSPGPQ